MKTTDSRDSDWLKPGEAASALGVSVDTVARLADKGEIRAIRPGGGHRRYAAADVEAIVAGEPWEPAS
ncbi:MAG TPA: helix-turn-helix domain-containing protein [Microbacterium sp.]|nr:helix-turn-helix domain-containing protein [Microbacterium sp.]